LTEPKKIKKKLKKDNINMSDKQNKQNKLHFIIRALWLDEKNSGGDIPKKWDTGHVKTDHTLSRITSTVKNMSKKGILPKQEAAQPEDASEKYELEEFFELFELSDKAATKHFTRIVSGDFPWSKLNQLATGG
jgi:hypothetical protein